MVLQERNYGEYKKLGRKYSVGFENVVLTSNTDGYDSYTFINNPTNKIDHIVMDVEGIRFPKENFFSRDSLLNKRKVTVNIIK